MKIIQVATLFTPENAYGGPTTVALGHCRALREAGHDVVLAAAAQGYPGPLPTSIEGVPVRLFPARRVIPKAGFAGLTSPGLLRWLSSELPSTDAVHVHLARDLVTLPAAALALRSRTRLFAQTHGMIDPSSNPLAVPLDAALTRRVLRRADHVFHLTDVEAGGIRAVAGDGVRLEHLRNGVDARPDAEPRPATSRAHVLYLARVQERKRPLSFVHAATRLAPEFPDATFRMVGPDEGGAGEAVRAAIAASGLGDRLVWTGPADRAECRAAMDAADLYVLPSVNEPYPMAVLEAMASGLPVVVTDTCGLAPAVRQASAGLVTTADPGDVTAAVRTLLADPGRRHEASRRALQLIAADFAMEPIVEQLLRAYGGPTP